MFIIISSLFIALIRAMFLMLRASLPLQGLSILIIRISVATFVGSSISPLLGIYVVLIYSRGLLVLLAYFIALSPNQTLNFPSALFIASLLITAFILISGIFTLKPNNHFSGDGLNFTPAFALLNTSHSALLISIGLILILTIVAVVKVTRLRSKPIRP
jgi:hypothetical protein